MAQDLAPTGTKTRKKKAMKIRQWPLHLMLMPAVISAFIFYYIPMAGNIIAFQNFVPAKGLFGDQKWIGFDNFKTMFMLPTTWQIFRNTLFIAVVKIILNIVVPVSACLMLNEIRSEGLKRSIQTMVYLPHFLSWAIFGGILLDILSPSNGAVNKLIEFFGGQAIYFLGDEKIFPWTVIVTDIWKGFGFSTIVYLAAISNIDPTLYEAASMDGAKRYQQVWHITLPGLKNTIVLLSTLAIGSILNAGFEQILTLYSASVYSTGDIIDTYVYRMAIQQAQYSLGTAVGLMKSVISFILMTLSYWLAYKFANYTIF